MTDSTLELGLSFPSTPNPSGVTLYTSPDRVRTIVDGGVSFEAGVSNNKSWQPLTITDGMTPPGINMASNVNTGFAGIDGGNLACVVDGKIGLEIHQDEIITPSVNTSSVVSDLYSANDADSLAAALPPSYRFSGGSEQTNSGFGLVNGVTPSERGLYTFMNSVPVAKTTDTLQTFNVPVTAGTNSMSCGAMNCTSVTSTGIFKVRGYLFQMEV